MEADHKVINSNASGHVQIIDDDGDGDGDVHEEELPKLSSSSGAAESDVIDVESYLEQRDLCIAIERSLLQTPETEKGKNKAPIDYQIVDDYDDDDEIRFLPFKPFESSSSSSSSSKRKSRSKPLLGPSEGKVGESSSSSSPVRKLMFVCVICVEDKFSYESFNVEGCTHSFCSGCVRNYVASKLDSGICQITCPMPDCYGLLDPDYCREIIPPELFAKWGRLQCESVILASQKFYCPFKDCSALLIDDGGEAMTRTECPNCKRMFCAECKVAWHEGASCDEYKRSTEDEKGEEDIMLKELADRSSWKRCPVCKIFVERVSGCNNMRCRCGASFCYCCGNNAATHNPYSCPWNGQPVVGGFHGNGHVQRGVMQQVQQQLAALRAATLQRAGELGGVQPQTQTPQQRHAALLERVRRRQTALERSREAYTDFLKRARVREVQLQTPQRIHDQNVVQGIGTAQLGSLVSPAPLPPRGAAVPVAQVQNQFMIGMGVNTAQAQAFGGTISQPWPWMDLNLTQGQPLTGLNAAQAQPFGGTIRLPGQGQALTGMNQQQEWARTWLSMNIPAQRARMDEHKPAGKQGDNDKGKA
ncbi:hypothetical protein Dimus_025848 [Dionaea muscipula]